MKKELFVLRLKDLVGEKVVKIKENTGCLEIEFSNGFILNTWTEFEISKKINKNLKEFNNVKFGENIINLCNSEIFKLQDLNDELGLNLNPEDLKGCHLVIANDNENSFEVYIYVPFELYKEKSEDKEYAADLTEEDLEKYNENLYSLMYVDDLNSKINSEQAFNFLKEATK